MGRISGLALPHPREPLASAMRRKREPQRKSKHGLEGRSTAPKPGCRCCSVRPLGPVGNGLTTTSSAKGERLAGQRQEKAVGDDRRQEGHRIAPSAVVGGDCARLATFDGACRRQKLWLATWLHSGFHPLLFCLNQPDLYCFVAYTHAQMTQLIIVLCE